MDDSVIRAMTRWPNVPAVYGWLGLDRRGCWRLRGERITHGGAIEFINQQLIDLKRAGCAILLVSVELDEILALADRIMVMNAGRVVGTINRAEADRKRLGLMMAGVAEGAAA